MTNEEAKMFLDNLKICIDEHPVVADWLVEIAERKTENSSEKPNNCEHITEDGVTCAKYPACDDCLDNPLNKAKGSERLVKGSEQTEPTISKMEQVDKDINVRSKDEPQTMYYPQVDGITPSVIVKTEPQMDIHGITDCDFCKEKNCEDCEGGKDEPQTDVETMSCEECKYYRIGKPCEPFLNESDCSYEPKTDCSWK